MGVLSFPPQIIISVPVHTAVCIALVEGTLVVEVACQVSEDGVYLPPVLVQGRLPPQTIISVPVQTAEWHDLTGGALVVEVATQVFEEGVYLAPLL